ncbi:hypothetical protein [Calothrix sp. FACHB-168]|nr:hypothetical protein [Calothrix sp. FACHB-168]
MLLPLIPTTIFKTANHEKISLSYAPCPMPIFQLTFNFSDICTN